MENNGVDLPSGRSASAGTTPFRLALIDNDESVHHSFRTVFHGKDEWIVESYFTAGSALRTLQSSLQPDVVLMNLQMPDLDGIECTWRLKAQSPDLPVVILADHRDCGEVLRAITAGACGYLVKHSIIPAQLVDTMQRVALGWPVFCLEAQRALLKTLQTGGPSASPTNMSRRQREILSLMHQGLREKEIADNLGVETSTVHSHVKLLYKLYQVHSRNELLEMVFRSCEVRSTQHFQNS